MIYLMTALDLCAWFPPPAPGQAQRIHRERCSPDRVREHLAHWDQQVVVVMPPNDAAILQRELGVVLSLPAVPNRFVTPDDYLILAMIGRASTVEYYEIFSLG